MTADAQNLEQGLILMLRSLKLPGFAAHYREIALQTERKGWSFGQALHALCEVEMQERRQRRTERLLKQSGLPSDKTLATLDKKRLSPKIRNQLASLCDGQFLSRAENLLAFGLPGRGKTHLLAAIGHELIHRNYAVYFTTTCQLVQQLLRAKRDLVLDRELRRLDRFDAVILDDIGYVQQDRDEMEVLFTFLAERYKRKSVMITSNFVFSQWDRIFKDPMTTAAAIDRLVHHSIILELDGPSIREAEAAARPKVKETDDNYPADDN